MTSSPHIGIIADFNAANFARMTSKYLADQEARVTVAPFGQVMQTLMRRSGEFWDEPYDLIVVWTFPGAVIPRFDDVLQMRQWSVTDLASDVDTFAGLVEGLRDRAANVFVSTWVEPAFGAHRVSVEMKPGVGMGDALMRMNLRLAERLGASSGVVVFNTERWLRNGGADAISDKLWYLSKTPYSTTVFDHAARDVIATFRGGRGARKKVVIVDLDDTLWGGIVGDVGWEGLRLGGHDPVGEAFVEFQRELKGLARDGIVLAIVSKNDESVALGAIDRRPEMILRTGDFAAWRINWTDKAQNVADLMMELNLGLDSAVFIDDSPFERSRVREALPEVLVPDWPTDPMDYAKTVRGLRCFESPSWSTEDRQRTTMYVSDRERRTLRAELGSVEQWLEKLDLEVHVELLSTATLNRASQLLNKTNQMNLTTRRLSPPELDSWAAVANHRVWTFRVRDRFGDYGLCGVASVALDSSRAVLSDFVLSCRAMGRGVEETILCVAAEHARADGAAALTARCAPTKKNAPCIRWFQEQPVFTQSSDGAFELDLDRSMLPPSHVRIVRSS